MHRKGKGFLSAALIISFSVQLILFTKIATSQTVGTYNPIGYNLVGATVYTSGALTQLESDDSVYMTFRSYYSRTDTSDFVGNDVSDIDSYADVGTLSNFDNMKTKDGMANLTEGEVGGGTVWLWQEDTSGYSPTSSYETVQFWSSWTTNSTTSGMVTKLGIYVFADPGNSPQVKLGIYDDSGGSPNNLLGETNAATITGAGWLDLDLVGGGVSISASTTYHVAHITDIAPTTQWRYLKTATPVSDFRYGRVWPNLFDPAGITTKSGSYRYGAYRVGYDETSDYRLDQEVQWTDVPYLLPNEELCIYGGPMGAEDIKVDVWSGSSWQNLFTDLSSGWNNLSVSSYLNSSTFTIRFRGSNETSDAIQDSWNIDIALLHAWFDEYTTEVEFVGLSDTETWAQLDWSVDSAWTVGSVSITLQLYNYSLGEYPTNGNGYVSYISNAIADIGEMKNQTITVNPTDFRNSTGYWKVKIKGVKITDTPFDFKADLVKYEVTTQNPSQAFGWFPTILYTLPVVFGLLFLLTVKLKRKKKKDIFSDSTFSESFGMTHRQMIGKKMLLEIDPKSDYHKVLFKFLSEARNSGELLFIFTSINSPLHSALSGAENVKFFLLTSGTSSLQKKNEKETLLPAHDLSVLLNTALEVLKVQKDNTINMLFDNLSSIIIRRGFKKTYNFMHFLLEAISSPKATAVFVFNPAAHDPEISSSIRGLFQNKMAYTQSGPKVGTL